MFTLALLLTACVGGGDDKKGNGNGDSGDLLGDSGEGDDTAADVRPVVESVDRVECGVSTDGDEVWQVEVTMSDPQGVETLSIGTLEVMDGEVTLGTFYLACSGGKCTTNWDTTVYPELGCSIEGSVTFAIKGKDKQGNESEVFEYDT